MNWIKLTDELPKHKQNIDLWLQPESGEGRRFNWTWEGQDSAGIMINGIKATHWIDVGKPSESKPADLKNSNCTIFDVSGSLPLADVQKLTKEAKELVVRLLPPIEYGEDDYADRLYEILEIIEGVRQ